MLRVSSMQEQARRECDKRDRDRVWVRGNTGATSTSTLLQINLTFFPFFTPAGMSTCAYAVDRPIRAGISCMVAVLRNQNAHFAWHCEHLKISRS